MSAVAAGRPQRRLAGGSRRAGARLGSRPLTEDEIVASIGRLHATARRLAGSREDAEDLVQDTLLAVLGHPREIAVPAAPYLLTALHNTWVSEYRRRGAWPRLAPLEEADAEPSASSPDPAARALDHCALAKVGALPPRMRDVVLAVDVCGLTYRQAATALGVPTGTIMSRLCRGRRRLASTLAA
jgi:RNA polymerase sigma-70 factor (ECF subfamily)